MKQKDKLELLLRGELYGIGMGTAEEFIQDIYKALESSSYCSTSVRALVRDAKQLIEMMGNTLGHNCKYTPVVPCPKCDAANFIKRKLLAEIVGEE